MQLRANNGGAHLAFVPSDESRIDTGDRGQPQTTVQRHSLSEVRRSDYRVARTGECESGLVSVRALPAHLVSVPAPDQGLTTRTKDCFLVPAPVITNGPCGLSRVSSQRPHELAGVGDGERRLRAQHESCEGTHHDDDGGTDGTTQVQLLLISAAPPARSARSSAGRLAASGFCTPTRILPLVTSGS